MTAAIRESCYYRLQTDDCQTHNDQAMTGNYPGGAAMKETEIVFERRPPLAVLTLNWQQFHDALRLLSRRSA